MASEWTMKPQGWRGRPTLEGHGFHLEIDTEGDLEIDASTNCYSCTSVLAYVPMATLVEFLQANGYRVECPSPAEKET